MNDDPVEAVRSVADATKSVSDTTRKGMVLIEKAGAFFAKVLGEDAAGVLKDSIFYFRAKNAVGLQDKLDRILKQRQITNPKAIPLRLAIPFLEAATLEDDEILQERWAHLLAYAMDPQAKSVVQRCYGELLSSMSPFECLVLERMAILVFDQEVTSFNWKEAAEFLKKDVDAPELLDQGALEHAFANLDRNALMERLPPTIHSSHVAWSKAAYASYIVTDFAFSFLQACGGRSWEY